MRFLLGLLERFEPETRRARYVEALDLRRAAFVERPADAGRLAEEIWTLFDGAVDETASTAARLLGVSYKTLLQKIRLCGLSPE